MTAQLPRGEPAERAMARPLEGAAAPTPAPPRWRWGRLVVLGAVAVAAVAAAGWLVTSRSADGEKTSASTGLPPATAPVARQDLVETQQVDGTLGYGDQHNLVGGEQGTITWLAAEGATVSRGQALYRVDNQPAVLLYGSVPLYRPLRAGVEDGPDVKELEENLDALGYTGFTVDETYTSQTAAAVEDWQRDLGLEATGVVEPGRALMAAGPIRVAEQRASVGGQTAPGQTVLTWTGTTRVVSVDLDVEDLRLAREGAKVTVELPGDGSVKGTISSVGKVAQAQSNQGDNGPGTAQGTTGSTGTATIDVTITLDSTKGTGTLDQAPVTVDFVSDERKDVLTVPVTALLALREGGYGVEVVEGTSSRTVPVQLGMFADGRVEVRGAGVTIGTKVGVPKS
jgi:peptidoglycan hydrolase-like protein with peptidoglycan-binding domain